MAIKENFKNALVNRCSSKFRVTKAATVQCVECPFRKDPVFSLAYPSTSMAGGYLGNANVETFEEYRAVIDPIVAAQSGPFSCHMRHSQHCFGAQEVQPNIQLEKK